MKGMGRIGRRENIRGRLKRKRELQCPDQKGQTGKGEFQGLDLFGSDDFNGAHKDVGNNCDAHKHVQEAHEVDDGAEDCAVGGGRERERERVRRFVVQDSQRKPGEIGTYRDPTDVLPE